MNKILFSDFSFTDLSWVRQRKQAFSALTIGKVGRFPASYCLSIGHNARIAPISFFILYSPLDVALLIVLRNAIESHWLSSCSNLLENRLKIPRNQFLEVTNILIRERKSINNG